MNKCCGECYWYTAVTPSTGTCGWRPPVAPLWYLLGLLETVRRDDGSLCPVFVSDQKVVLKEIRRVKKDFKKAMKARGSSVDKP
jgi:hypothetical protein